MDEKTRRLMTLIRDAIIQLLNSLDDALGQERTIPTREQRRILKQLKN